QADIVTHLPGQPPVTFAHYSGYIKLQPEDNKALFYWFIEAEHDASLKPLVLWLQGGPGCSSIAIGAVREVGPFLIQSNGTQLTLNDFSWNKVANMLFLESPAGIGFSYTNDNYSIGDESTANNSLAFLLRWFKRFPSFKSSDCYHKPPWSQRTKGLREASCSASMSQ
ncbi:Peptidase_S10 domain-containing protein, partial [Cephalotus follicularis]